MKIEKVLFITLSNIGDAILTLPVLDVLRQDFPKAKFTVISGERPKEIFRDNPNISELIVYDKRAKARDKKGLFVRLKDEHFDLIVDLRDTLYGRLLSAKYRSKLCPAPKNLQHMKDRHLWKIQDLKSQIQNKSKIQDAGFTNKTLYISQQDQWYIKKYLARII